MSVRKQLVVFYVEKGSQVFGDLIGYSIRRGLLTILSGDNFAGKKGEFLTIIPMEHVFSIQVSEMH